MTQTTYPVPPQPQQPKKKRGVLKWILIILAIIVGTIVALTILVAVFAGSGEDTATPAGSTAPTSSKPSSNASEVPTAEIGDNITDDGYQFTVTKVKCGVRQVGDQYAGEKPQGQFCLVSLQIKNVSKDPITFASENQAMVDTKGNTYSPDDEAWVYVDNDDDLWGEINPGNTLTTIVPFDVPKKAEPDFLLLKAGVFGFSEGVRVKL